MKFKQGKIFHIKKGGDTMESAIKSIVESMRNAPSWWGCRNCDYEEMVDKVPMPDDGLCLRCRDHVYNRTNRGVA